MIRGRYSRSSQSQGQKKDEKSQGGWHREGTRERERQNIDWRNTGAMSGGILEAILQTSELILSAQEATERLPWALTLSEM